MRGGLPLRLEPVRPTQPWLVGAGENVSRVRPAKNLRHEHAHITEPTAGHRRARHAAHVVSRVEDVLDCPEPTGRLMENRQSVLPGDVLGRAAGRQNDIFRHSNVQ